MRESLSFVLQIIIYIVLRLKIIVFLDRHALLSVGASNNNCSVSCTLKFLIAASVILTKSRLILHVLFFLLQAGNVEMTWVISDFVGNASTNELSVTKGQQVEVLEMSATTPDYCLVRVTTVSSGGAGLSSKSSSGGSTAAAAGGSSSSSNNNNASQPQEGLVPMSILKPPPTFSKTSPRRTLDLENAGM